MQVRDERSRVFLNMKGHKMDLDNPFGEYLRKLSRMQETTWNVRLHPEDLEHLKRAPCLASTLVQPGNEVVLQCRVGKRMFLRSKEASRYRLCDVRERGVEGENMHLVAA